MNTIQWIFVYVLFLGFLKVGAQFQSQPQHVPGQSFNQVQSQNQNRQIFNYVPLANYSKYPGMPFNEELCSAEDCALDSKWTSEEKCAYIKCNKHACEGGGYLKWSMYVKCQYNIGARVAIIVFGIIYLFFLFVVVSTIAEEFFCPSISGIVTHLRMSESIAGVTLLAFGNGAPDVLGSFSSVLNTAKPKAGLALGDLFGTSIFVTTVVLAVIILTKSFRVAIVPAMRDLIFYFITLGFITFCFLKFDKVEVWMPATFLGIYVAYVLTVILFELYRKRRSEKQKEEKVEQLEEGSRPASAASDVPMWKKKEQGASSMSIPLRVMIRCAQFVKKLTRPKLLGNTNSETIDEIMDEGKEAEFAYAHHTVFTSHDQVSLAATEIETITVTSWKSWDWVRDPLNHLKPWPCKEEFLEMNIFEKILTVVRIVPMFFIKMTVPSNEMSWCKPLFILHCFASVQFVLFAIRNINLKPFDGSPGLWLYGLAVSAVLALLALIFLPLSKEQKYYREVYSYLGFLMSIVWIYTTSNEIISVVTMVGVITGVSMELLGLTVMSWSDCIGDIVTDIAVVKQGFPNMAIAAVLGGSLFNLLIGFGLPFTIAAAQGKYIELLINPVYRLLLLFLGISLVTTFVALLVQRFKVRWPHAVMLIIIFITFVIFVCLAEFNILEWK